MSETISYLTDMDGVLIREGDMIPGADVFLQTLRDHDVRFMVLTNNSIQTPRDLSAKLQAQGLRVEPERIWTSATATAKFLTTQAKAASAYVIGEAGLTTALHDAGLILTDYSPDVVVLGETRTYSFEAITTAINLIREGARFIATNPDVTGPAPHGILPATGSVAALITAATGRAPYYVGKPNPVMMRTALNKIGAHSERTVMIGDRMDTDVRSGLEAGMRTILVRTGISDDEEIAKYPYRPWKIVDGVVDLAEHWDDPFGDGYYHGLVEGERERAAEGAGEE
ncbi:HAD-IIA family hydrolase [Corynebacterium guangdongense]|uniref:NagD protein n=1 Tax=Corynebacterium guangdongense TaxID=1783348 RepID=A0ABU1ZY42_9CORY|nr:HAD-IIA family hydrolase [Corynebacterium guangdongense]MDR7329854.1 NagD protein [Corynebacterium guangdongense]WJZ18417.1 Ribonucleotide monophosphatase NagD [Corynebacterium guangdongense]